MDRKWLADGGDGNWMAELARSLDWVNLMTYDYHGTWENASGHVAPLMRDPADPSSANVDDSVKLFLAAGIPAKKLTLGMPFYAKAWEGCAPGPKGDGLYQPCIGPLSSRAEASWTYDELAAEGYLAPGGGGFSSYRNEAARVPYLYNADTRVFIGYDDGRSIAEKVRYARSRGLLGVMFWALPLSPDLARGLDD
jgi:chitinase